LIAVFIKSNTATTENNFATVRGFKEFFGWFAVNNLYDFATTFRAF
jgi:hypothetical protein